MDLICPRFRLTWYPGAYPSDTGGVVLLGPDDLIDAGSSLNGSGDQQVDVVPGLRAPTPKIFARGNRSISLEWTTVTETTPGDPNAALVIGLASIEAMPDSVGWVRIDLDDALRSWAMTPAAVRSMGYQHDPLRNQLRRRWSIQGGLVTEIAGEYALTLETGDGIELEAGGFFELETAA